MSARKQVVERYIDGFRAGDHAAILECLTDDVSWSMPPFFELSGRAAFEGAIENPASPSRGERISRLATYQVDREPGDATLRAFKS